MRGGVDLGTPAELELRLLGGFELRGGGRVLLDRTWTRSRAKALLKLVAIEGQVHRERVLDTLWPELDATAAAANLRKNLHHLRSALAEQGSRATVIAIRDDVLALGPAVALDVAEFRALARAALADPVPAALDAALTRYGGDLLPEDRYEDWAAGCRAGLLALRRQLLVQAARWDEDAGQLDRAADRLETVLQADPVDEDAHRALMRVHLRSGSRHRALRQYRDCARLMHDELGLDPSEETVALRDAIAADCRDRVTRTGPVPRGAAPAALFGREAELERAVDLVDALAAGHGGTLLIGGAAGIGKSLCATEILVAARAAGARTALCRGFELEAALAYQPIRDALGELAADPDVAAALRHTVYVKRLIPGAAVGSTPVADPVLLEAELIGETVHVLTRLAAQRPLVLVVEDLHAADTATVRLLHALGRQLPHHAALLVGTYRTEEVAAGSVVDRLVVGLRRDARAVEIDLGPLPPAVVELVVRERFDSRPVDAALLRSVVAAAEGNPLFAIELVNTVRETGAARFTGGRWQGRDPTLLPTPTPVRDLVERRLGTLDRPARAVLSVAAVLGREFDLDRVSRAAAAAADDVLDALDRAIGVWLVEEHGDGYRFRHQLVRAAVYDGLSRDRRRRLHRAVAGALVETGDLAGVGHHLALSDQPWQAVPYLGDDARRAAAVFANAAALAGYRQAIALARQHGERGDTATLAGLLEELGDLLTRTGDASAGAACMHEALGLFQQLGDEQAVLVTRGKAALGHLAVGEVDAATELLQTHIETTERLAECAEETTGLGPTFALGLLADIRWHGGQHREALAAAERAVDAAESGGDVEQRARAYESISLACHSLGDWRRGLEYELQRGALDLPGFTDVALDAHY